MRNQTDFYGACEVIKGFEGNKRLQEISGNNCFDDLKCDEGESLESDENFVGYNEDCKCSANEKSLANPDRSSLRHRRQSGIGSGEIYATASLNTRLLRTPLGGSRIAKDSNQLFRKAGLYIKVNQIALEVASAYDEEAFELGF